MGQSGSAALARDTISGEQFMLDCRVSQKTVSRAFDKCIDLSTLNANGTMQLSREEQTCVEEYTGLYASYLRSSYPQFMQHYELHQREAYERARAEHAASLRK